MAYTDKMKIFLILTSVSLCAYSLLFLPLPYFLFLTLSLSFYSLFISLYSSVSPSKTHTLSIYLSNLSIYQSIYLTIFYTSFFFIWISFSLRFCTQVGMSVMETLKAVKEEWLLKVKSSKYKFVSQQSLIDRQIDI